MMYSFIRLVMPFSRRLQDKLRDRLHCIAGLCHEHKCLPGLIVMMDCW